uniref:Uncharacterized protein n=1 Tax=Timema cristinae TaxID=61476 RepID=A0A7R9DI12_TIMCR|nr:unnamed protein product [Timema cristinae]
MTERSHPTRPKLTDRTDFPDNKGFTCEGPMWGDEREGAAKPEPQTTSRTEDITADTDFYRQIQNTVCTWVLSRVPSWGGLRLILEVVEGLEERDNRGVTRRRFSGTVSWCENLGATAVVPSFTARLLHSPPLPVRTCLPTCRTEGPTRPGSQSPVHYHLFLQHKPHNYCQWPCQHHQRRKRSSSAATSFVSVVPEVIKWWSVWISVGPFLVFLDENTDIWFRAHRRVLNDTSIGTPDGDLQWCDVESSHVILTTSFVVVVDDVLPNVVIWTGVLDVGLTPPVVHHKHQDQNCRHNHGGVMRAGY